MTLLWVVFASLVVCATPAGAQQNVSQREPRRQFVTVTIDGMNTYPINFKKHPLEQLAGTPLNKPNVEQPDYVSPDGATRVSGVRFRRKNGGAGLMIYPFGAKNGPSLAVRASIEQLPEIRFLIEGPDRFEPYDLSNGRAFDIGVGVIVNDRSPGWGLGSHAFVLGGIGRLRADGVGNDLAERDGKRWFAEGGGGMTIGPFGVQLSVKISFNQFREPRAHGFYTAPLVLRGTLSL